MADITRSVRGRKHPRNAGPVDDVTQFLDPYLSSLLHFNGADGSVVFTDQTGKTWTPNGNVQIDTAQSKFGGASGLFDGTGDFLLGNGSADFAFGSGDFTIEMFIRFNTTPNGMFFYDSRPNGTNGFYPTMFVSGGNLYFYSNSANLITGTTTLVANTWYHIGLARAGTATKLFLNGNQEGSTYTDSNNYVNGASRPLIGADGSSDGSMYGFNGWIDEFRVSKGIARWTANFTPPTTEY